MRNKEKAIKGSFANYLVGFIIAVMYLFPIYILINLSFKTIQDMGSKVALPEVVNLGNYISAFSNSDLLIGLKNSIIVVVLTVAVEILVSALGAYGIARSNSKLTQYIRQGSMAIMMIPAMALLVGTYSLMVDLKMTNTLWGLALLLAAGGTPACMFMYTNFIISIPEALDEAATIDGAGTLKTFFYIILPQLKAVTVTRIIMAATGCWNQYLMPMYLLQDKSKHTIILVIKSAFNSFNGISNIPKACAICVLGILPIILLYLLLQRYIVEGQIDSVSK